jgi:hypothetical protein
LNGSQPEQDCSKADSAQSGLEYTLAAGDGTNCRYHGHTRFMVSGRRAAARVDTLTEVLEAE